ncbi:MAG: N-acetylmuramoyl-L-alanine amidase [Lysobacter sp.]|nr:N-acetylmuramoyl-L-alanine amidase [Lysobacter sp.]MDQ3268814.1 N-acetylmuramoyl-L-alanine amidase [Pseudomonadota bacterium]
MPCLQASLVASARAVAPWVRGLVAGLLLAVLAACSSAPVRNPMAEWHGSPNYDARRPRLIVLHQTQMESADSALLILRTRNAGGRVSAHYLIGRDGRLYQLVSEQDRAWHAGAGSWGGIADVNSASIGIELDNNGQDPFTEPQIQALLRLLEDVTGRLGIARHLVIAHGDVAPARKRDPGVLFPWRRLAQAGFGLWPREALPAAPPDFDMWAALRLIGYDLRDPAAAVRAFHRHFRSSESELWLPGDAEILFDLQAQSMQGVDAGSGGQNLTR